MNLVEEHRLPEAEVVPPCSPDARASPDEVPMGRMKAGNLLVEVHPVDIRTRMMVDTQNLDAMEVCQHLVHCFGLLHC